MKDIINFIPYGHNNAVTRDYLMAATGLTDRWVRKHIERARKAGALINNDQDGAGYYQSIDLDHLERQFRQDTARAMAILDRRQTIRKILLANGRPVKELDDQLSLY